VLAIGQIVLALAVGHGPLPIDGSIRDALHVGQPIPPMFEGLNAVGAATIWDPAVAVLIAGLVLARRRWAAAALAIGLAAGETLAIVVKLLVDRQRPPGPSVEDLVTQASFPSGHVTRTLVTLGLMVLLLGGTRRRRIAAGAAAVAFVGLMAIARILSGEHWPTDVLGGIQLGGIVVLGVAAGGAAFRTQDTDLPLPGHA